MNFETVEVDDFEGCIKFAAIREGKHVTSDENTPPPRPILSRSVALWGAILCGPLGVALGMLPILWSPTQVTTSANLQHDAFPPAVKIAPAGQVEGHVVAQLFHAAQIDHAGERARRELVGHECYVAPARAAGGENASVGQRPVLRS